MQISDQKVVTLDYTLTNEEGNILDKSEGGQFAYLHGAANIIPGLEKALTDKAAGDSLNVNIPAEEGYGPHNNDMIQIVERNMFEPDAELEVGMQFHAESPDGQPVAITIAAIDGDNITIDGNHPLAGINLNFDINIIDVRDATQEEVEHGHVHGPEGHHHG